MNFEEYQLIFSLKCNIWYFRRWWTLRSWFKAFVIWRNFVFVWKFLVASSADWAITLRFVIETGNFTFDSTMSRPALKMHITFCFMGTMAYFYGGTSSGSRGSEDPHNLLFYGYHGIFLWGYIVRIAKLNTQFWMAENLRRSPSHPLVFICKKIN